MNDSRPFADPSNLHFEFPIKNKEVKFKELVKYISHECVDDPTYSLIKLLKILFFSDFESYGRYGVPITGMRYRKLPYGPVPVDFPRLQEELLRDKEIKIHSRRIYEFSSQRLIPLTEPNLDVLEARHIAIVDGWIRFFWNKKATEISEYSHGKAWKIAQDSELIPYEAVFISHEPVTFEDVARAKERRRQSGPREEPGTSEPS
jgi:antitoxin SocA-like protein